MTRASKLCVPSSDVAGRDDLEQPVKVGVSAADGRAELLGLATARATFATTRCVCGMLCHCDEVSHNLAETTKELLLLPVVDSAAEHSPVRHCCANDLLLFGWVLSFGIWFRVQTRRQLERMKRKKQSKKKKKKKKNNRDTDTERSETKMKTNPPSPSIKASTEKPLTFRNPRVLCNRPPINTYATKPKPKPMHSSGNANTNTNANANANANANLFATMPQCHQLPAKIPQRVGPQFS